MENTTEKTNKNSWIYILAAAAALAAFIMASCSGVISGWLGLAPEYKLEDFKKEVSVLQGEHSRETKALYDDFKRKIATAGSQEFQEARGNINAVVKHFTGYKTTAYLVYLMAYDTVKRTQHTHEYISKRLGPAIISPCVSGNAAIQDTLKDFLHKLQEKDNLFRAELAQKLNKLPAGSSDAAEGKKFIAHLEQIHSQIGNMVISKTFTAVGLTVEAFLLRKIIMGLRLVARKVIVKAAGSAALAAADGPLPIGDILAVAGLAWCAYDIYQLEVVMPRKLRATLGTAISEYRRNSRDRAIRTAERAMAASRDSVKKAIAEIQ